jgi:SAM-dependent methyltransferase
MPVDDTFIEKHAVQLAHDHMAREYDQLDDLWYPWLYCQIHAFIASHLKAIGGRRGSALDVGCGTGFQSFLLAQAGFDVVGFDISDALLAVAQSKVATCAVAADRAAPTFATNSEAWIDRSCRRVAAQIETVRGERVVSPPLFKHGDAADWLYEACSLDVITCCGSVLSFIDDYSHVLESFSGALRPGGILFLEVEQKRNLDMLWALFDGVFGGVLHYDQTLSRSLANLVSPPGRSVRIRYPFELHDGSEVELPLWIFSVHDLAKEFERVGLETVAHMGIHHATNLLPSTLLHRVPSPAAVRVLFALLRPLDGLLAGAWPFWRLGCSVVYCLRKRD